MRTLLTCLFALIALPLAALELDQPFDNIDGGTLRISDWSGQPVLVVNTASHCGFSDQYTDMQKLYDTYRDQGLVVLAVPSDDFNQELGSNAQVKEYCEMTYGIDMPMTGITSVKGGAAHPFYASLKSEQGFAPAWNFNKVLLSPEGEVVATYPSSAKPMSSKITRQVEELLN
ncbi:MAG: glutathione peroxidase [Roseovarius sp.]